MQAKFNTEEEEMIIDNGLSDLQANVKAYTKSEIAQKVSFIKEVFEDFKYRTD